MRDFDLVRTGLVDAENRALVPRSDLPRARFQDTALVLAAIDAGLLYPIYVEEVMPGSLIRWNVRCLARMSTPVVPLFSNQQLEFFAFFRAHRQAWTNWERFMGAQPEGPTSSIAYTCPKVTSPAGGWAEGSLSDFMGLPINTGKTESVNAFAHRMYNAVYNLFVRDQNSMEDINTITSDGPNADTNYGNSGLPMRITKKADYFTRLLPWPQKFTAPTLFPAAQAPVTGIGVDTNNKNASGTDVTVIETGGGAAFYDFQQQITNATTWYLKSLAATPNAQPEIYANLAAATGITINAFRQSMLVQQLLEKDARGGTQYIEMLREQYGANPPDFRLQRPEFCGGGSIPFNITPVAQTAPVTGDGVGDLAGAGHAQGAVRASVAATEHGVFMLLVCVRTEQLYQQGTHPMWDLDTRLDFPFPILSGMGEEPVKTRQLYTSTANADAVVLGYNPRYEYMRHAFGGTRGVMRSTAATPIDQWHLGIEYSAPPVLGATFLNDSPPMDRVLQVSSTGVQYRLELAIDRDATLPLPMFGVPAGLIHF